MDVVAPVAGGVLILVTLREVFHMLFHPSGKGRLTIGVFRAMWALTSRMGARARAISGPLSVVLVIALWTGVLVVAFALIYWRSMPEAFMYSSALEPGAEDEFLDAVYFSWVTQATLGYGDIAPAGGPLRLLAPLQATLGFGLFTLFVTWVLSVYPALHRQRAAASSMHALRLAHERATSVSNVHPATLARQMEQLSDSLNQVRVDFLQYPSTFYFAAPGRTLDLAHGLPHAVAMAHAEGLAEETRPAAAQLAASLELFASALAEEHLEMTEAGTDEVLRAYRRHHGTGRATTRE